MARKRTSRRVNLERIKLTVAEGLALVTAIENGIGTIPLAAALVTALGFGLSAFVLLAVIQTSLEANIASRVPQRASVCAISLVWWTGMWSSPPQWMSIVSPSRRRAIAEHSMCHPGRPGPTP